MRPPLQRASLQKGGLLVSVKKATFLPYTQTKAAQVKQLFNTMYFSVLSRSRI